VGVVKALARGKWGGVNHYIGDKKKKKQKVGGGKKGPDKGFGSGRETGVGPKIKESKRGAWAKKRRRTANDAPVPGNSVTHVPTKRGGKKVGLKVFQEPGMRPRAQNLAYT